ncbi:MAG: CUB domain-containing protein, partial [Bacteroidales bacterium]|nr:CUB domain-containing protein [Bacteroidales bacterium]
MQPLYSVIKKAVLFAGVFLGYIYGANAQYNGTLTLGTGTITDSHSPIYSYYYNSYNQMIYTASEIGTGHAGTICSIEFRVSSGTINTNVNVYLGHTAKTSFNNNTDWIPHVLLTQVVYNQYINFASGWVTLTFAVPFAYNGTNNLIVAVEQQNGSYSMVNFYNTTQPNNKTLYYYSDYNTFNYASPSSGTMMTNRANIRLNFANCSESIRVMSETPITNCNFLYVDQGGLSGNYNNNQNIIQTITSTNNEHLRISFQQFALSSGDYLSIYDGNNISAPLIGTYTGNTLPPTSTSSSNTLTFRFVSNATGVNAGWLAQINCLTCTPQPSNPGSPCNNASISPFCTEIVEGVEYNSGTGSNTNAVNFFDTTSVACLHTIDHPSAWFYLRINNPGNLLMEISQHRPNGSAMDVDFACWGPFNAATPNVFLEKLCCGFYTFHTAYHSSHHPTNGNHNGNTGGYPFGNLIDCSYDVSNTEWCYIPNAQVGEFYLILITNFGGSAGTVSFQQVNTNYTSGTSDCSLVSTAGNNGPYCVGDTIQLLCQTSELSMTYLWSGPNGFSSTLQNPIIPNATLLNNGTYTVMVSVGTDSTTAVTEVIVNEIPDVHITASALEMCSGGSLTLTASGAESYQWSIGSNSSNPILNISMVTFVELTYVQYAVTGISNGCSNVDTITICVINRPDTTRVSAEICFGETYQQHNF